MYLFNVLTLDCIGDLISAWTLVHDASDHVVRVLLVLDPGVYDGVLRTENWIPGHDSVQQENKSKNDNASVPHCC